ncbi:MAG TPA: bifunctional phosphoribosylaminoimidazolecarboxamide formyltransferase/IMP cyclohydrolase [Balneolaceae bacterium]|nr:bifunctional phosphoribosylaminoimidazolecarboxamide formyltransferase/IMP cyclohydrolase [Balneolaceae bacterium]
MDLQPLSELPETPLQINRALLSVADKKNIIPLAQTLHAAGVEIISTGGTAQKIRNEDIPVTDVSQITDFEECLDGRVKTLHPTIHAGILARTSHQADLDELERRDITPIELVVGNLYPFEETISRDDCTPAMATENIDIGGPTMIRAAAKNFAHVCVLTHPDQYDDFIVHFEKNNSVDFEHRQHWAQQAFNHTAQYDVGIANYFNDLQDEDNVTQLNVALPKSQELRYGENPHQKAAVYGRQKDIIDCFHGKKLSYNNFLDVDSALNLIADFEESPPTCAIFKHTVPCGVAVAENLKLAWDRAFATDTSSPFGGIIVVNRPLDVETAGAIDQIFTEIILAPSFSAEARELLQQKKNRRLIRIKKSVKNLSLRSFRSIFGGALSQQQDQGKIDFNDFKTATEREPTEREINDLLFAWKVVKHVKSNGIVYARDGQTIGIGTGQTSRIESSEVAIAKAHQEGLSLQDTVIASDAFFPFADGLEAAAEAGATAAIQPGGSIRDDEVIAEANRQQMAMIFTGKRHFRH